jgi:manganese/zinc/iron transport system permease protein
VTLFDPTVGPVAVGAAALGAATGAIGTLAVVRRRSLQGDAVSHAALPGVALAYLVGARTEFGLVVGAACTGGLAMAAVAFLTRRRVPFDAALAAALAVFFGLGLVLVGYLQRSAGGAAGVTVQQFLFGDPAFIRLADLGPVLGLGGAAVLLLGLFWKEFKVLAFDPEFAAAVGLPTRRLDLLLTGLTVVAVVIGLRTVGVVLMSALIVAPASAARQWSDRLGRVTVLAAAIGAGAGFAGVLLSHALSEPRRAVPTGPTIVLVATAAVVVSLLFAPGRGLAWDAFRHRTPLTPPALP